MKFPIRYCENCGTKMAVEKVGSENYGRFLLYISIPYPAYDRKTGKKNYHLRYFCPNNTWFNRNHEDYGVDFYHVQH